jgi:hypothetical protein
LTRACLALLSRLKALPPLAVELVTRARRRADCFAHSRHSTLQPARSPVPSPRRSAQVGHAAVAASSTGDRETSPKVSNRWMRSAGMSRTQYQSPAHDRRRGRAARGPVGSVTGGDGWSRLQTGGLLWDGGLPCSRRAVDGGSGAGYRGGIGWRRQAGSGVLSLAFDAEGRRLATGLWDTTTLVWDLPRPK